jgi:3-methyladenine DNA glycosylase/8-oxoguanine DNA glycosylase
VVTVAKPLRLLTHSPFHLEATVRVLQRRPANLIDVWESPHYRRTVRVGGRLILIRVENRGTVDLPDVRLSFLPRSISPRQQTEAGRIASEILALDLDPSVLQQRAEAEPALRRTALALRGMRPPRYPDLFETFANVIPFQQLSLQAGMAVTARLIQRFGELLLLQGRSHYAFPNAERVADARVTSLKRCGLSTRKSVALRSGAKAIASGSLTAGQIERLPSSEAMYYLMQLAGIGAWSAALVLLRGFRRLDMFPQADTGAESSLVRLLRLRSRTSLHPLVNRFGEHRGYLYFYGIASRLLAAGLIHPAPQPPTSDLTAARALDR